MAVDHVSALKRSRAKLVEQRRVLVKRDCSSDRNEGYAERIVAIQAAIEATDRSVTERITGASFQRYLEADAIGAGT